MVAFWENLHTVALEKPDHIALTGKGLNITYHRLSCIVNSVAAAINAVGIQRGDRVAVTATKTLTSVAIILGTLQAGAVVVPINPLLKSRQRGFILDHCGAKLLFCPRTEFASLANDKEAFRSAQVVVITQENEHDVAASTDLHTRPNGLKLIIEWAEFLALESSTSNFDKSEQPDADLGAIIYTSGSTGTPKGVMLTRSNLQYGALSVSTYLQNTELDRILALMPLSFDYGLSQLTTVIQSGACLVLHDYLFPKAVIEAVLEHRVTGLPAVPHLWDQLMTVQWPSVPHLRYATSTGGTLQEPTMQAMGKQLASTSLYSMYGFTEAFRASYLPPAAIVEKPTSIGIAVPFAKLLVVDAEGNETEPFEAGEIIQSGHLVTAGYWNDSLGTKEKFRTRNVAPEPDSTTLYAWSGDVGYKDHDGYLYFVSRRDDLVKLNGHRVSPAEIERNLILCETIEEICVLCVPNARFGLVAVAFVVSANSVTSDSLTQWARRNLPAYMVPLEWFILPELPSSSNNKIDRNKLMQQYKSDHYAPD